LEFCRSIAQVVARRFIVAAICAAALLCLQSKCEFALANTQRSNPIHSAIDGTKNAEKDANSLFFAAPRLSNVSSRSPSFLTGRGYDFLSRAIDSSREMAEIASRHHGLSTVYITAHDTTHDLPISTTDFSATQLEAEKRYLSEIGNSLRGAGVITYTFRVKNTGNVTLSNIVLADTHNGYGTPPTRANEALFSDVVPLGDSTELTPNNGTWTTLTPGDSLNFTAPYIVIQQDVDLLQ
jgi:hypothetical protein